MMKCFLLLILTSVCFAAPYRVELTGHISQMKCTEVQEQLSSLSFETNKEIDIVLSSTSGDLKAVLQLTSGLAKVREKHDLVLRAYIYEQCIGPLAMVPFVCQDIVTTPTVSWGAITIYVDNLATLSIVEARIRALIPEKLSTYSERVSLLQRFVGSEKKPGEVVTQHELATYLPVTVQAFQLESREPDRFQLSLNEKSRIGRIVIRDQKQGISEATYVYVKSALDAFREQKVSYIILELNTPGGEVFAAQRISNLLRSIDLKYGIPVIAYINNWAISAGAMLAYSCRYIVVAPDASMGAATPVIQTAEGVSTAPEKINSALRTDFANRAAFFGRDANIARAMVDPDLIVVRRHGEITVLSSEEEIRKGGYDADEVISAEGKLLTLTGEEMVSLGVANFMIPKSFVQSPDAEISEYIALGDYALISLPGFSDYRDVPVHTFEMDLKTSIIAFLISPVVSSLLFFIAVVCIYFEFSIPGFGLPGILGGLALVLMFIGSHAQEAITWFEPICLVLGLGLIAVELFIFPIFGIFLFIGGGLVLFGLLALLIPGFQSVSFDGQALNAAGQYVLHRLAWLSVSLLLALGVIIFFWRRLPLKSLKLSGIVLESEEHEEKEKIDLAVGDMARVVFTLRPAGKVNVRGKLVDAISEGRFIDQGEEVKIVEIRGNIVIVEGKG